MQKQLELLENIKSEGAVTMSQMTTLTDAHEPVDNFSVRCDDVFKPHLEHAPIANAQIVEPAAFYAADARLDILFQPSDDVDFASLKALMSAGNYSAADLLAKQLHQKYHLDAWRHVRVHHYWSKIAWQRGEPIRASSQALAGYVFAAPATYLHRYGLWLGVLIKAATPSKTV